MIGYHTIYLPNTELMIAFFCQVLLMRLFPFSLFLSSESDSSDSRKDLKLEAKPKSDDSDLHLGSPDLQDLRIWHKIWAKSCWPFWLSTFFQILWEIMQIDPKWNPDSPTSKFQLPSPWGLAGWNLSCSGRFPVLSRRDRGYIYVIYFIYNTKLWFSK